MIAEDNTMPIRMGYIICRPPCKTKMQGPCSKGRGKVPLKVLKYQDFPLILLFQPGVVYLLFNAAIPQAQGYLKNDELLG